MKNVSLLVVIVVVVTGASSAADWPQFRGPGGRAVSEEKDLPVEWSETKNLRWKTLLPGPGSSSPIVFGDRVYLTCYSGYGVNPKSVGNPADLKRHMVCIDRKTGKVLWNETVLPDTNAEPPYHPASPSGFAAHTPVADELGVYGYFGSSGAIGFRHTGERRWHAPCGPTGSERKGDSSAASLIIHGNSVILNDDHPFHQGDTIALDKQTGREVWREKTSGCYITPHLVSVADKTELVIATTKMEYLGLDPTSGKRLWDTFGPIYAASPSAHDGIVYITGGDKRAAIKAGGQGRVTYKPGYKLWESPGGVVVSSPVIYQGHMYWVSDKADLVFCADVQSGKIVHRERLPESSTTGDHDIFASPIVAGGRLIVLTRKEGAFVLTANPKLELLAHNKIAEDDSRFNATPAVSGGCIFLRSDRYLYCIGK